MMICSNGKCRREKPDDGLNTCEKCRARHRTPKALEAHRIRNRAYHERHNAEILQGRRNKNARRKALNILNGNPDRLTIAKSRDEVAVRLAECLGYVPSIRDIQQEIGGISMAAAAVIRRRAFRLVAQSRGDGSWHDSIPFPVPKEFLAPNDEWKSPSQRLAMKGK